MGERRKREEEGREGFEGERERTGIHVGGGWLHGPGSAGKDFALGTRAFEQRTSIFFSVSIDRTFSSDLRRKGFRIEAGNGTTQTIKKIVHTCKHGPK